MEELYRLIPDKFAAVISSRLNSERITELRIRNGLPVRIGYAGAFYYLCESGITSNADSSFIADKNDAEKVILRACDRSLYTVSETLKKGFVSVGGGIRIGVCGSGVVSGGAISAVKDYTSVNIRIPHEIKGCASTLFTSAMGERVKNTLIVSSPGLGKTTVLRDLCRQTSMRGYNVMLCDERYEIAACCGGEPTLDVGPCSDIYSGIDKASAFRFGIAYMRPDVIMTDELFGEDLDALIRAVYCGISVVCTAHARDVEELGQKAEYKKILESRVFSRFAVINSRRDISVYDGGFNLL